MTPLVDVGLDAVLSADGRYRYRLSRIWGGGKRALFVMLNPSTADAYQDDPTIRRSVSFARRERCAGIEVVNLFAFRATKPTDLFQPADPIGPDADMHLRFAAHATAGGPAIVAWGAEPGRIIDGTGLRRQAVRALLRLAGHETVYCLGRTKSGAPRHPLYLPADAPLEVWS